MKRLMKRIGIDVPIVEMFSNDPRLADLDGVGPGRRLGPGARAAPAEAQPVRRPVARA